MKKYIAGMLFAAIVMVSAPSFTHAVTESETQVQSTSISELLVLIQSLMKQVESLQKQLTQVREELKDNLREGVTDEDVKKIQEMLATDSDLYPRGIVSGYFGPLTKDALKRFQARHELALTGEVDAATKKLMLEYFKERKNGKFPAGLLNAPGIAKKIRDRLQEKDGEYSINCDDKKASGPLCKEDKSKNDEEEDEEENDDDEDSEDNNEEVVSATTMSRADLAISDAKDAISDLKDLLAASITDSDSIEDVENEFADAENYLAKAKVYFAKKDYRMASYYAEKAQRYAEKGVNELDF